MIDRSSFRRGDRGLARQSGGPPPPRAAAALRALSPGHFALHRSLLLTGVGATVVLLVLAVVGLVTIKRPVSSSPAARSAAPSPTTTPSGLAPARAAALAYVTHTVQRDAEVLTDMNVGRQLARNGFTRMHPVSAITRHPDVGGIDYVVSTPDLRAAAAADHAVAAALAGSVSIAAFGSGSDRVFVRQTTLLPAADVAARRRVDARTRRAAEQQLLSNPSVHAAGTASRDLQAGLLDLRAAALIALVAAQTDVDVVDVSVDPAERAAGLPDRIVEIHAEHEAVLLGILKILPSGYRVADDLTLDGGVHRLTWSVDPTPSIGLK